METLLSVEGGQWGYRQNGGLFLPARPVSFRVGAGEIVLLTGDNGSGKTTIIRGLLDLVPRAAGELQWRVSRRQLGYVPQESVIDKSVPATAMDVVRSGDPVAWGRGKTAACEALSYVGLTHREKVPFASLSGGQRQRVLVARALIGGPRLLLLDEPSINVDAISAARIGELLRNLAGEGIGMVVTSHVHDWVSADREVQVLPREDDRV